MSDFLMRNRLQLAKVETTSGTDASPAAASDAVLVEEPRGSPQLELEETDEATGSLDTPAPIVGGGYSQHTGRFFAKGSGTGGTEPEFAPYLRAAGMGVTTLGSDEDDTAQAGADGSITLASGATTTDITGFVVEINGGTGSGQSRVITGYNTTSKVATVYPDWDTAPDNTSEYVVRAGNCYAPASSALKTLTSYLYKKNSAGGNAILDKLVGAAVNLSFAVQTRQSGSFTYTARGILDDPSGVSNPTGQVFDTVRPRPLRDADAFLGGENVCFRNFTLDWGNEIVQPDCAAQEFGYEHAVITRRNPTGRINPRLLTLASRDPFSDLKTGTAKKLWLHWGEDVGNRVSMLLPSIFYTGQEDDDLDGLSADGLPFAAKGNDSWIFLLFY